MKHFNSLFVALFLACGLAFGQNAPFSDIGFENMPLGAASSTAWVFEHGSSIGNYGPACYPNLMTYITGNTTADVVTVPLLDGSGYSVGKSPYNGNKVMAMNNPASGGYGTRTRISQNFSVTASNFMFRYAYQGVLETAGGSYCDAGCLLFKFYDCNNNLISTMSYTEVPNAAPGPMNADGSLWQQGTMPGSLVGININIMHTPGWVLHTANLSAYIGSCIRVEVICSACICGAKPGYCYYDCESSTSVLEAEANGLSRGAGSFTSCSNVATLQGAAGFNTYSWQGPVNSGVGGSTNSLVTTSVPGSYTLTVSNGTFTTSEVFNLTINSAPASLSVSASNSITCAGTSVTLQATSPGLNSYDWQGGTYTTSAIVVTPLYNSWYDVVVTNSLGCSLTAQQLITIVPTPTIQIGAPSMVCPGQSTSLTVSGTSMGTYSWSTGSNQPSIVVSPTAATMYSLTGTNINNCTVSASKLIITYTPVPMQIVSSDSVCPGQPLVLSITDPSIPTYTWTSGLANQSNTVYPAASTFYLVYGTDGNGCSTSGMKSITVFASPQIQITPVNPSVCFGQAVSLSASASGNSSFMWNTGSSNATITDTPGISGTYIATATDSNNCSSTASVMVTVNSLPQINIQSDGDEVCDGAAMLLNADNSGYIIYSWSNGDNNPSTTISPTILTVYTLTVTDANGCSNSTQKTINVQECTGIEAYSAAAAVLQVFPNPTADSFTIKSTSSVQGYIVNALGQVVSQVSLTPQNNFTQSLNGLAKGVYTIKTKARSVKVAVQ